MVIDNASSVSMIIYTPQSPLGTMFTSKSAIPISSSLSLTMRRIVVVARENHVHTLGPKIPVTRSIPYETTDKRPSFSIDVLSARRLTNRAESLRNFLPLASVLVSTVCLASNRRDKEMFSVRNTESA